MPRITLATCQESPVPIVDEPLRNVLMARGHTVNSAPWNGAQDAFYDADIVVIRACWDYSESPDEFTEWIRRLEQASIRLHNQPDIIRWNMNKRYLLDLQAQGIRMPETVVVTVAKNEDLLTEIERHGWDEAGHDSRLRPDFPPCGRHRLAAPDCSSGFRSWCRRKRQMREPGEGCDNLRSIYSGLASIWRAREEPPSVGAMSQLPL